jgi:hypothetical protein
MELELPIEHDSHLTGVTDKRGGTSCGEGNEEPREQTERHGERLRKFGTLPYYCRMASVQRQGVVL